MSTEKVPLRMNREDRRAQILDAAMSVFVEKGFTASTTLEIAKAANISEVTLFSLNSRGIITMKGGEH